MEKIIDLNDARKNQGTAANSPTRCPLSKRHIFLWLFLEGPQQKECKFQKIDVKDNSKDSFHRKENGTVCI